MKGRLGGLLAVVVVSALIAGTPAVAGGAPSPEERRDAIAEELERLREEVHEAAAEEAAVLAELQVTRRTRGQLDAAVAELDRHIAGVESELAASQGALELAVARWSDAERKVAEARARLDDARRVLQDQAVSSFMRYGAETATLDVFLQVRDVRDLHDAVAFVDAVARAQAEVVERHQRLQQGTIRLQAEAERAAGDAAGRRDAVAAQKRALEEARAEQAAARGEVAVEEGREAALLATAREARGAYEKRISALEAESRDITALLRRRQAAQAVTPRGSGTLGYPLANAVVTSRYGFRTHPIFGTRRLHAGVDFRGATGTPVLAASDGTVVFAGPRGGYGNAVVVDHGGSLATLYAHQSRLAVAEGARVRRGQAIGAVGSTGFSTGPHLHFEVRLSGTPVDPLNYL